MQRLIRIVLALGLVMGSVVGCAPVAAPGAQPVAQPVMGEDPLPSWNAGPTKESILRFVADVTDANSPSYVPPAERIAVFDNDGTLWSEKPVLPQAVFAFDRVAQMAPDHPEWQTTQPFQAVLERDQAAMAQWSAQDAAQLVLATHAGMTEEEFEAAAQDFLATATHPRFGRPYTETVYQPMLELIDLLQANEFRVFIVSGGGVEFVRAFSEEVYGIPKENVIGSSVRYQFELTPEGSALVRLPQMDSFDDKEAKPANIQLHIGRRPLVAVGNSDGDLQMLQYTAGRAATGDDQTPYLNLLVVHDDAEREYDYLTNTDAVMAATAQSPWLFVSMENDFKTVFPPVASDEPVAAGAGERGAAPSAGPSAALPAGDGWQVDTLLAAPGEPGRLYALIKDSPAPLWGAPATGVQLLVSDDFAETWTPFAGGLPVPDDCVVHVSLDYGTADGLYVGSCQGLYAWESAAGQWVKRSYQLTDALAVAYGQPQTLWAAAHDAGVLRSNDGGATWTDASAGLITFGGLASLGLDPRDNATLYAVIQPQYAGSYLRRGTAEGNWVTMPTPDDNAAIATGLVIDGSSGALYVTTLTASSGLWRADNPAVADVADVEWQLVHDFGAEAQVNLLAGGWGPQGTALYANMWPLTPLAEGGALVGAPVLSRSLDGGVTWEPLPTPGR